MPETKTPAPTIEEVVIAEKQKGAVVKPTQTPEQLKIAQKEAAKLAAEEKKAAAKAEADLEARINAKASEIAAKAFKEAEAKNSKVLEEMKALIAEEKAKNLELVNKNKELEDGLLETDVEALEKQATALIKKATEINEEFSTLASDEAREEFINALEATLGMTGFIKSHFTIPQMSDDQADPIPVADDLPLSEIVATLPVRIMDQALFNTLQDYTLGKLIKIQDVRNGLYQIFYGDYKDADGKKAYDDVTLADFNGATTPAGTENFQVDTDVHTSYKIMDAALNDVTTNSMGLFLAIVSSATNGFVKPMAKKMYSRLIDFLDTEANYDEILDFPAAADIKAKSKFLAAKLFSLKTTSRTHLKKIPQGLTKALEYKLDTANATLILNKDFATNYKFDLTAMTFQLGEITYPVKAIIILDFDLLSEYLSDTAASVGTLKKQEVLLFEDGVYGEIKHYSGTKQTVTPKLFSIFHSYTRIKNYRRKDKLLLGFRPTV